MPSIPFTVYDFFGYLASGFLFIIAALFVGTKDSLFQDQYSLLNSIFLVLLAYLLGHLLAIPSKLLYERILIEKWLERPDDNLFKLTKHKWRRNIFQEYYECFPAEISTKILTKAAEEDNIPQSGKPLFVLAYARTKTNSDAIGRADIFLSLYGFCRNISFTILVISFMLYYGGWHRGALLNLSLCLLSILTAIGLFFRYLKFLRQYSYELFLSYLELLPVK